MARASTVILEGLDDVRAGGRDDSVKRRQVIDGARTVFLEDGFDGASMNEIARAAGVSKGTLYVYFKSKEDLFAELIREEKRAQAEQFCRFPSPDTDMRVALHRFALGLMDLMLRPASIAHLRTVVAVAGKFPAIGQAFYESGPLVGRVRLAAFLDAQVEAGRLDIDDTALAAVQFMELCKAPYILQVILNVAPAPSAAELERHVAQAIDTFIRAYRPTAA